MTRSISALALGLCVAATVAADQASQRGHLVLNGGGRKPADVMVRFVELAGGPDADIVVFPTASEKDDTGEVYLELFRDNLGCSGVWIADVRDRDDALDENLADRVAAADGIWFSGGDQRRITDAFRDTPLGEAVTTVYRGGGVVGGTSAGTACQSALMITGDGDFSVLTADNVELWPGLGLFGGVIVDQHFVARSRHNRLISVVLEHPELLGVGVDEATAVWVRPDGSFKVLGDGWVVVYDAHGADVRRRPRETGSDALGAHGMTLHVLLPGDLFDVPSRQVLVEDPWLPR
jgi:cyanophycinase